MFSTPNVTAANDDAFDSWSEHDCRHRSSNLMLRIGCDLFPPTRLTGTTIAGFTVLNDRMNSTIGSQMHHQHPRRFKHHPFASTWQIIHRLVAVLHTLEWNQRLTIDGDAQRARVGSAHGFLHAVHTLTMTSGNMYNDGVTMYRSSPFAYL